MNTETILLIIVIVLLIVMQLRTNWRLAWLEYQALLTTEVLGLQNEGRDSPTARVARERINRDYRFLAALNNMPEKAKRSL